MEKSILTSTKKALGLLESYTAFDQDILMHINATFGQLTQLGIGPSTGFMIEDKGVDWDALILPIDQRSMVQSYVYLNVRLLFDPPTISFVLDALKEQITKLEFRLSVNREMALHPLVEVVVVEEVDV